MNRRIYVSGMHSGQNPCSGVGIVRSIRKAFPELTLVGVDHWQGSSGLHDSALDDVLIFPQWHQIDDARHADFIRSLLDEGNIWISALDLEVRWLAENVGAHPNLLAPGELALKKTEKPAVRAIAESALGIRVPDYIPASLPDSEIHRFLRHNNWQCWLKSPFHDAKRISSWGTFDHSRHAISKSWRTSDLFVQKNVFGNEECISFACYQGELLGAVQLEKRLLTPEGKTWAGRATPVSIEVFTALAEVLRSIQWNGGGEIEYVRDPDGQKWMIECNPRFPAWIYGGALSGINLPARLVAKLLGLPLLESLSPFPYFTRVVQEIPARELVGLPLPPDPSSIVWTGDGKKGKGGAATLSLPTLSGSTDEDEEEAEDHAKKKPPTRFPEAIAPAFEDEIRSLSGSFRGETPARVHLEGWTGSRFETLAKNIARTRPGRPEIRIGYSVKTSPTSDHLRKAKAHGFYAECISQMEVRRALDFGFKPHEVILNGPGKFWPLTSQPVTGLHMLFCDSLDEFDRVIEIPKIASVLGFRMRIPKLHSRFGNPLENFEHFQGIVERVKKIKGRAELGFHFHMPSWAIGMDSWMEALRSLILWCQTIEHLTGSRVRHLDLGGGFFPTDLEKLDFQMIQQTVGQSLSEAHGIYFEPGRSLTQDGEVLVSRVLDVRKKRSGRVSEVVVDACIAELPLVSAFTHRIFYRGSLLKEGKTKVLGRICMEDDILSNGLALPDSVAVGDLMVFGDAGGYERTMSYAFGRG